MPQLLTQVTELMSIQPKHYWIAIQSESGLGDVAGKKVVIVGDILHSRVALSNIFALKLLGAEVKVCGPKTLLPKHIESLGVGVESNIRKALDWCDVANMLRVQNGAA